MYPPIKDSEGNVIGFYPIDVIEAEKLVDTYKFTWPMVDQIVRLTSPINVKKTRIRWNGYVPNNRRRLYDIVCWLYNNVQKRFGAMHQYDIHFAEDTIVDLTTIINITSNLNIRSRNSRTATNSRRNQSRSQRQSNNHSNRSNRSTRSRESETRSRESDDRSRR